jgi:hypothetical protein
MAIVDFHMHFFSRPFFDAMAAQSPQPGSVEDKLVRVSQKTGIEIPPGDLAAHTERWLKEMELKGVEHMAAFASLPDEIPALAEAATLAAGRLTPFALVNPLAAGTAEKVEELMRENGFGGVLLFPAMHHFAIDDPEAEPLLEVLDRLGGVAYVHCGLLIVKLRDMLGIPRPFDLRWANPLYLIPAANAHPNVDFVVPHFGAGFFRETLMAGAQCANVYVDTSSSNGWIATQPEKLTLRDVFERALSVFGTERVLFGTDSNVFPAGWRRDRADEQRRVLEDLGMDAAGVEAVFSGNAKRLLA